MHSILTLGLGPQGSTAEILLLGLEPAAVTEEDINQGGWLSPEQARAVIRKVKRRRSEKAKRAEELRDKVVAAEEAVEEGTPLPEAIEPVREVLERDTGPFLLDMMGDLYHVLAQLEAIDDQLAAVNRRRMDEDAAVLLLTDI